MKRIFCLIAILFASQIQAGSNSVNGVLWVQNRENKISAWVISDILAQKPNAKVLFGTHLKPVKDYWLEPLFGVNLTDNSIAEILGFKSNWTGSKYINVWLEGELADYSQAPGLGWSLYLMVYAPVKNWLDIGVETSIDKNNFLFGGHMLIPLNKVVTLVPHYQERGRVFVDVFIGL